MRCNILIIVLLSFISVSQKGIAQSFNNKQSKPVRYNDNVMLPLTAKELSMLDEVYVDQLDRFVLSNPQRVKAIKHLLRNRIVIKTIKNIDRSKYTLLSEIDLRNKYNPSLKRDDKYIAERFNPLKYNLPFYAKGSSIYKIDNSDYFLFIKPQS